MYKPGTIPDGYDAGILSRELTNIRKSQAQPRQFIPMQYLAVLPDRPLNGLYLFDAAVVSGAAVRGLYRYDETAAAYTFIA